MSDSVLVHYEVRGKVALLTLDDPPANTYTHEMMRQLDECIVRARFDEAAEVIVLTGQGEVLLLPARQRDAQSPRADPEAGHRGAQRAHGWRWPRDRDGR